MKKVEVWELHSSESMTKRKYLPLRIEMAARFLNLNLWWKIILLVSLKVEEYLLVEECLLASFVKGEYLLVSFVEGEHLLASLPRGKQIKYFVQE